MSRKLITLLTLGLIVIFNSQMVYSSENEFAVKAAFIKKLLHFVEWPNNGQLKNDSVDYSLCIFENSPLISHLLEAKNIKLITLPQEDSKKLDFENCDVLFISNIEENFLNNTLQKCKSNQPILTFSDTDGYAKRGVMVNFYVDDNQIRFEINWNVTTQAGFQISSRVLKLARIVNE